MKPLSESCLRNQQPILSVLSQVFDQPGRILELGSGTGQHAAYMSRAMPHLRWQPSDLSECLPGMRLWCEEADLDNLCGPISLDVLETPWPVSGEFEGVFTANTIHFVGQEIAKALILGAAKVLSPKGVLCIYGPFNEMGEYSSDSNRQFDGWLKARDPASGIKDIEWVEALLSASGVMLQSRYQMPANNLMLVFERVEKGG